MLWHSESMDYFLFGMQTWIIWCSSYSFFSVFPCVSFNKDTFGGINQPNKYRNSTLLPNGMISCISQKIDLEIQQRTYHKLLFKLLPRIFIPVTICIYTPFCLPGMPMVIVSQTNVFCRFTSVIKERFDMLEKPWLEPSSDFIQLIWSTRIHLFSSHNNSPFLAIYQTFDKLIFFRVSTFLFKRLEDDRELHIIVMILPWYTIIATMNRWLVSNKGIYL